MSATHVTAAWSCTVRLVVADERVLRPATEDLVALLARVDAAASRFRADSALSRANAQRRTSGPGPAPAGRPGRRRPRRRRAPPTAPSTPHSASRCTASATTATSPPCCTPASRPAAPAAPHSGSWRSVRLHREAGLLTVPVGTALDLGATAKAWTADHAARTLAARYGTAVLVELGGDVAVAGDHPEGWTVQVAEHEGGPGQLVTLRHGGLTTSTTTVRTWEYGAERVHHILDPRTGRPADGPWRTATVWADSALIANTASTAAIVLGEDAEPWLTRHGLAARLVARDGTVTTTAGWPARELAGSAA